MHFCERRERETDKKFSYLGERETHKKFPLWEVWEPFYFTNTTKKLNDFTDILTLDDIKSHF